MVHGTGGLRFGRLARHDKRQDTHVALRGEEMAREPGLHGSAPRPGRGTAHTREELENERPGAKACGHRRSALRKEPPSNALGESLTADVHLACPGRSKVALPGCDVAAVCVRVPSPPRSWRSEATAEVRSIQLWERVPLPSLWGVLPREPKEGAKAQGNRAMRGREGGRGA